MTVEYPDVEGGLRAYLRADADVSAIVGNRVFFGVPRKPTWPLVVVSRVGGGSDLSDAPVDVAALQIDCWGELNADGLPIKAGATALVNAVCSALDRMTDHDATPSCRLLGVSPAWSSVWLPDPDNDRPRYVVTAEVTALLP